MALLERQHRARNLRALDELFARESRYLKTMSQLGKRKAADPDLRHKFRKAYRAHVGSEVRSVYVGTWYHARRDGREVKTTDPLTRASRYTKL